MTSLLKTTSNSRGLALRHLALIGLLSTPIALVPCHAAELVGKPASVSSTKSSSASTAVSATETIASAAASASHQAAEDVAETHIEEAMKDFSENFKMDSPDSDHHQDHDFDPELLIPILGIIFLFGGPVILVIVLAVLHYRNKSLRQQQINLNIDKLLAAGRDIPVELLMGDDTPFLKAQTSADGVVYQRDDANMQKGVRNIGLGLGWLICLSLIFGIKLGSFGFIWVGLGISQVVIWKLSAPKVDHAAGARE